jgi:hypothetical protein
MSTNNKTVAPAPALLARLAQAKAAKQQAATATATELRKQLEAQVGELNTIPALETIREEAKASLSGDELVAFEQEVDRLVDLRKAYEKAEAEARRLKMVSTTDSLEVYLDKKVEAAEKAKEAEIKAKAEADKAKAKEAREEEIANVLAKMAEGKEKPLTEGQRDALTFFLRGNPAWKFTPTPAGKTALLKAAEAASAACRKTNKIKARAARAAQAEKAKAVEGAAQAAAPLTHNMKV